MPHGTGPRPNHIFDLNMIAIKDFKGVYQFLAEVFTASSIISHGDQSWYHFKASSNTAKICFNSPKRDNKTRLNTKFFTNFF